MFADYRAAGRSIAVLIVTVPFLTVAAPARAAGTPAGTTIVNIATATYVDDTLQARSVSSNSAAFQVEELLDVALSTVGAQPLPVLPGSAEYYLTYRVTNTGNGPEAFGLVAETAIAGDQFDPTLLRVVVDSDGDGLFDPMADSILAPGGEPVLAPDASVNVFVFVSLPAIITSGDEGIASLSARAMSGSGQPGSLFPAVGEGGSDAVVGSSGGAAALAARIIVGGGTPTLAKSQSFGGQGQPTSGTVVTYTLAANLSQAGAVNPVVADSIPAGTRYVPGSLTLGGAALSDAPDGDAGSFSGTAIEVALDEDAAGPQFITFQVEIN